MEDIIKNLQTIADEFASDILVTALTGNTYFSSSILGDSLEIIKKKILKNPSLKSSYNLVFCMVDFDSFSQIKELYSTKNYDFLPTWEKYFTFNSIKCICLKKSEDPIRLIFTKIKSAKSSRDDSIRSPYWVNLFDIDYACYYKLFKYLLLKNYTINERINVSKFSRRTKRAALETNVAFVFHGKRIKNVQQCIDEIDDESLIYLVEFLGMKLTWNQLNQIEKKFDKEIYERILLLFD